MEGTRCDEIETSSKIQSKIKIEPIIEIDSIFYEKDGKLVELNSGLQEDFCAIMDRIKYENTEVAEEIETVCTEPATLSVTCQIPRSEQSLKFSRIISGSTDYTSLCRLCATRSNSMVHMFCQNELQNNIIEKIEYCLPIEVKKTDTLPKEICHLCIEKLELSYQFHKTVEATAKQFFIFDDGECNEGQYQSFTDWDAHGNIIMQKLWKTDTETLENSTTLSNSMLRKEMYHTNRPNEKSKMESSCNFLLTFPLHIWNDMEEKLRFEIKPSQKEEASTDKNDDDIVVREEVFNKRRSVEENIIDNKLIKCQNCRENFETVNQCFEHSCIHTLKDYFPCCLCSAIIRTKEDTDKHRLKHKKDENLRRGAQTSSGNQFPNKSLREAKLKAQIKLNSMISTENELYCKKCNKDINPETSLRQHMLTAHEQQKNSFHNICERELRCEVRLNRIVYSASDQLIALQRKPDFNFECKLCSKRFSSNFTLEVHEKTNCNRPLVSTHKTFSCMYCGRRFRHKGHWNSHISIHTGERPYDCDLCGKLFGMKIHRDSHRRIHTGDKPFKCSKCEKGFTTASGLLRHSLIHSDAKPYSCHLCRLSFKTLKARDSHLRTQHTGNRPYKCSICEKRFPTPAALTRHSVVHSDAKPYSCHLCHLSFKLLYARDLHLRIHTGERPYKCDICGMGYITNSRLLRHTRTKSCLKTLAARSQMYT